MPPKKKGGKKGKKKGKKAAKFSTLGMPDAVMKSLKNCYERNCAATKSVMSPKIKQDLLKCIENENFLVRFILEVLPVEKGDDPQVKLEPLLQAIRQERYIAIKELYVWDLPLIHEEIACLGLFLEKAFYPLQKLELMDCLIEAESMKRLGQALPHSLSITQLIFDYNEFGDEGVRNLCDGLVGTTTLLSLSLNYCNLTAESGSLLGELISTTTIRELFLDGNELGCEGAQELIKLCAEQAELEAFERAQEEERKRAEEEEKEAQKVARKSVAGRLLESPIEEPLAAPASAAKDGKKKKKKGKKKKKKEPPPPPQPGPWIHKLHLSDNGIDAFGRGSNFAPLVCMRMFKKLLSQSNCLKELDLELNLIGDLAGREIMEALEERKEAKLPGVKVRTTHRMNNSTFEAICKLGTGKIAKKKKKGKKKKK